ncbi:MAG TPA: hypothetical protein VFU08_05760 [Candidatus Udaeobacter sp.]|nr:hypothetical protein [Candidatus Udaeobacter sp.]
MWPREDISTIESLRVSADTSRTNELAAAVSEQQPVELAPVTPRIKEVANDSFAVGNTRMWAPRKVVRNLSVSSIGREH